MNTLNVTVFIIISVIALSFDYYHHRKNETISTINAIKWVIFYIGIALLFACFIYVRMGWDSTVLFLTGWGLEKVLAIDNLVVFAAILSYFNIPDKYQHRVLYFGIVGAIVLRLIFVTIGISISDTFSTVSDLLFGVIILYTAWLMYTADEDDEVDYYNSWYIKATSKWLPVTAETDGGAFFIKGKATIFFFALVAIELSDVMFAFDSVPAVISVTKDPFLVYTSIMFAIFGLRTMYFVLASLTKSLVHFELAVIFVLLIIAAKLIIKAITGFELSPNLSLIMILLVFATSIITSKLKDDKQI